MQVPEKVYNLLFDQSAIQAAYLFGSRAKLNEKQCDSSHDWDFAIVVDKKLSVEESEWLKYDLQGKISALLGTDKVDIVVVNPTKDIELAYAVTVDGYCFIDRFPERDNFERHILHEYCDHIAALARNGFGSLTTSGES